MKSRLDSGVTYQSRANIFPPVRKNPKKVNLFFDKNSMYNKIHEHFSKFDLLKLNIFGDDIENYGNITLKGISYPPKKIKMNYITKSIPKEEEKNKNNKKIFNFEDDDIVNDSKFELFNSSNRKIEMNKNDFSKLHLPLLKMRKNLSTGMLSNNKFDFINNKRIKKNQNININKNIDIKFNQKRNNISFNENNIRKNEHNNMIKNNKSKKLKKEKLLPLFNNNISVTNKNIKIFIQTNKLEVKTDNNKKNHILNRNSFLKRYDNTAELNNRLNELKNDISKVNMHISKIINKNDEDIPQFKMRFNYLFSKFKN